MANSEWPVFAPTYICTQIPLLGTRFSNFIFTSDNASRPATNNRVAQSGAKRQRPIAEFSLYLLVCNLSLSGTFFFNFIFMPDNALSAVKRDRYCILLTPAP